MKNKFLRERRKSLEEAFFARHNADLLKQLQQKASRKVRRERLSQVSGITDSRLLDHLIANDVAEETVAALAMIPLVAVAWADGRITFAERQAVVKAASEMQLQPGHCYELLEHWLHDCPSHQLLEAWKQYIRLLSQGLSAEDRIALRKEIVGRAREVAEAAGGFLGLVHRISEAEKAVLAEMEAAF